MLPRLKTRASRRGENEEKDKRRWRLIIDFWTQFQNIESKKERGIGGRKQVWHSDCKKHLIQTLLAAFLSVL
jgi:hypothetical protein